MYDHATLAVPGARTDPTPESVDFRLLNNRFHPRYVFRTAIRTVPWLRGWLGPPCVSQYHNQETIII